MAKPTKPAFRYMRMCNHCDHPRGQCKERAAMGTERPDGAVEFKRLSSAGKKRKA